MNKLEKAQQENKKIVFVTGVFDLLHQAHKQFLDAAKREGEFLVVGLETDVRVRQMKGEGRPIENQGVRLQHIEELPYVDFAFLLPEVFSKPEDHKNILLYVQPAVLAVSASSPHLEKKRAMIESLGGTLKIVMEHDSSVSTTKIVKETYG